MRVLLVAHGYPPRETAGTEQHAAALAAGLRAQGHEVHVLAATRAPGRRPYAVWEEPGVTRVVNNLPARPLASGERDRAIEAIAADLAAHYKPDLVHAHHIQFLSSGLRFAAPVVVTLHDQWAWCAAGGTGLELPARTVCPGPDPARCAPCAAAWRPSPGRLTAGLIGAAGLAAPVVSPERLHALYARLPARLRASVARGGAPAETPADAATRIAAVGGFFRGAAARIAPSAWLARRAEARGLGPVHVVPHGVDAPPAPAVPRDRGVLFLGTLAWHKGPDIAVAAWRRAVPDGAVPLTIHGPVQDAAALLGHPAPPPLDRPGVWSALRRSSALIIGSRWEENAPLVALEARAAGCPVVAPAIGGLPELIEDGRDGALYGPGDVEDCARALRRVLDAGSITPRPPPTVREMIARTEAVYRQVANG